MASELLHLITFLWIVCYYTSHAHGLHSHLHLSVWNKEDHSTRHWNGILFIQLSEELPWFFSTLRYTGEKNGRLLFFITLKGPGWKLSRGRFRFHTYNIFVFICLEVGRTTLESWFSPSTLWLWDSDLAKSYYHPWWQAPLPPEPTHWSSMRLSRWGNLSHRSAFWR